MYKLASLFVVGIERLNSLALVNTDVLKENNITLSNSSPVG